MSATEPSLRELRRQLAAGEITTEQFRQRLSESVQTDEKDDLWARWAGQGLMNDAIEQTGYTSLRGNLVREVNPDGQR
jgi:predicted kinase